MQENGSPMENQNDGFTNTSSSDNEYSKWVDNQGDEVKNVFGFNSSAERTSEDGFLARVFRVTGRMQAVSLLSHGGTRWKLRRLRRL